MYQLPLLLFFAIAVGLALGCVECGFRLGERRRLSGDKEPESPLGSMVAATLGLLAFIIAFTFNLAVNKFDERKVAVLDEANAIGTTYLRADFLDQSSQIKVKKLLREYVALRASGLVSANYAQKVSASEALQRQLWAEAVVAAKAHGNSPVCALFVSSLNDMIDMHSKRVMLGFHARVPLAVWFCLFSVSALSMAGLGYYCGLAGSRTWVETFIVVTTFAIVVLLVADLDRPGEGLIRTNQQPLIDLSNQIGPP